MRAWCAEPGARITVRPLLDLNRPITHDAYAPTEVQCRHVEARDRTCVFPWCEIPATATATACDLDHITPWKPATGTDTDTDQPGQPVQAVATTTDNLSALCRHHHRLKTQTAWTYHRLGPPGHSTPGHSTPGHSTPAYAWTDPHGHTYTRTPDGTHDGTHVEPSPDGGQSGVQPNPYSRATNGTEME